MKRFTYLVFIIFLTGKSMLAQTTIWEENFNNPKPGWTTEGNWEIGGGMLIFNYYPIIINYDFSAISPEIVIPDNTTDLLISQFIETFPSSVTTEACEISVIFDESGEVIWNHQLSDGNWGSEGGDEISLSLDSYSRKTIRIKFRSWGPTTDAWWDWSIYFVKIITVLNNDLAATEISGPSNVDANQLNSWQLTVKNQGLLPQSGFEVKLISIKTGEEIGNQLFSGMLNPGDSALLDFEWSFGSAHNTCLYGKIIAEADDFQGNNFTQSYFVRIEPEFDYQILLWDNDNGIETIFNPETGVLEQPDAAFSNALNSAGIGFTLVNSLPENLNFYDIILCTLGSYCLS